MHEASYELGILDVTLIIQRSKVSPHKEVIKANLSTLLGADPAVVNLKQKLMRRLIAFWRIGLLVLTLGYSYEEIEMGQASIIYIYIYITETLRGKTRGFAKDTFYAKIIELFSHR
ncbi:2-c-methyl-d-erythritol 2 [Quercus suber]|uniref:2-c-methyl-d-erythritol 2 n=1 Tax=Quercus suber TaxID=58331 RepID=A0AAW0J7Q6_QUESU